MATAQPSPTPTAQYGASASWSTPQPAPAPTVGSNPSTDWNTQWNTIWNQAWNAGFNGGSAPSVSSSFSSAVSQGYSAGQQAKAKSSSGSTPTSYSAVPTPQSPTSSTPDVSGQTNDIMNEINNLYGQSNSLFNQQEQNLNSQKQSSIDSVNAQGELGKKEYTSAYEQAMASANKQLGVLAQSKQTAQSEAVRNFNAMQQSNQARFGNSSSAGGAVSELVSQEFLRNQGNTRQAFQNSIDKVYEYQANANQTFQLAVEKLQKDISDKIAAVNNAFQDGMLQIATQRTANEQAKSAARIELMRTSLANAQAIQNYKIETQIQLETWLTQQKQSTNDALAYAKQLATQSETNAFNDSASIQNINNSSFLNNTSSGNSIANVYRPYQQRTDEYSGMNPWLS